VSFLQLAADRLPSIAIHANLGPVHSEVVASLTLAPRVVKMRWRNHPLGEPKRVYLPVTR